MFKAIVAISVLAASQVCFGGVIGFTACCAGSSITYSPITVPGAIDTFVLGINDLGAIVGVYNSATPGGHGFLYSGGAFTLLDYPGALGTYVSGINDAGQIVGIYYDQSEADHGFVYSNGTYTPLNVPGASTAAFGINNSGQIVGYYYFGNNLNSAQGFLFSSGSFSYFTFPSSTFTYPSGINESGQIVGNYGAPNAGGAFLYSGGTFTQLEYPSATVEFTYAYGINDAGQIVGQYGDSTGGYGFIDTNGAFVSLAYPGAAATLATGINDDGEIAGYYYPVSVSTSTPEPSTWLMTGLGLIAVIGPKYCSLGRFQLIGFRLAQPGTTPPG